MLPYRRVLPGSPRTTVLLLAVLAGLLTVSAGVLRATAWAPGPTSTVRVTPDRSAPVLVAGSGALRLGRTGVSVRAIGATGQTPVFLGVARTPDALAVLGGVARAVVDDQQLGGSGQVGAALAPGEPSLPDPAAADVWAVAAAGKGSARVSWPLDAGEWTLVASSGGSAPAPDLELVWANPETGPGGVSTAGWVAVGSVVAAGSATALLRGRRPATDAGGPGPAVGAAGPSAATAVTAGPAAHGRRAAPPAPRPFRTPGPPRDQP